MSHPMTVAATPARRQRLVAGVRTLHPGYFALVMATGILSVGTDTAGVAWLSVALLWIAVVCYAILVVLVMWRIVAFRSDMAADLRDPARAFGFFTFVAATDVLGSRIVGSQNGIAVTLLIVAATAWLVLGYIVPATVMSTHSDRPSLAGANGTWFIWVVASQSVAVLAAGLETQIPPFRTPLALVAVFSWSVGVFLYGAVAALFAVRLFLYRVEPKDVTPPYWVAMGATAITVVAGSKIVEMDTAPMVNATRGLIAGVSVLFWAFGTWLIPALIALGFWRHVMHRIPLVYEPPQWSIIFPLGMYGVGSAYLGRVDRLPIVEAIGRVELWFALAAWAIVFVAMIAHLARSLLPPGTEAPPTKSPPSAE